MVGNGTNRYRTSSLLYMLYVDSESAGFKFLSLLSVRFRLPILMSMTKTTKVRSHSAQLVPVLWLQRAQFWRSFTAPVGPVLHKLAVSFGTFSHLGHIGAKQQYATSENSNEKTNCVICMTQKNLSIACLHAN